MGAPGSGFRYQKERKHLDEEAEFYTNRERPPGLKDAFATNKALTEKKENTRADAQLQMKRINERFDAERSGYLGLKEMDKRLAPQEMGKRQVHDEIQPPAPRIPLPDPTYRTSFDVVDTVQRRNISP